jgi:predicted metal-dependent phosphoesterase TrpH
MTGADPRSTDGVDPNVDRHHAGAGTFRPPSPSTVDLHTHTLRSDGLLTPSELVHQAAAAGVKLLAITDHDTLAGVRELRRAPLPDGLEHVPGIEINTVVEHREHVMEGEVHVLGLGVDPDDDALEAALSRQRDARRLRFDKMVGKLRDQGVPIDAALEGLPATTEDDALGRPRLARALIRCGYATSVEDAFQQHLSRGRPAYVPRQGLGPKEAIDAIRAAGGLASLAHYAEAPEHLAWMRTLIDLGLNGLEVYYRAYDQETVAILRGIAQDLRLVMTGGTDYHGDRETYAEAHAGLWVPPDVGEGIRLGFATSMARP